MLRKMALVFLAAAAAGCYGSLNLTPNDAERVLSQQLLNAPNPALNGSFAVKRMFYGSGTDKARPEYRDSVTIKTKAVDLSKFVTIEGQAAKDRKKYWGFEPKNFPVQGRVWYPEGNGPFPLVLVVHGNHNPRDFSDPGYGYLGELLASRGYILVSVDMNFINGLSRENDGRGIMLLEHLKAWKGFNEDPQNPFYRKVDFDKLALMGHSRGGEAVGHAAAFNKLTRYPDDATVKLDYGFSGLKAIVAIAPVDGQYKPSERFQPLENINYLVFHGSHDGDVTVFHGLRQYQRLQFTDGKPWFKAAVYVYRANHGQWNTVWQNKDNGPRSARILDLRGLLTQDEQREFGKVYISAFLDATLRGDKRYLPLFRDHRVAGQWLPRTMYITRFEDSNYKSLASFEEDVDVTSGSVKGVTLRADSMSTWRENLLTFRSAARAGGTSDPQNNQAVWLGWNNRLAGDDTTRMGPPATYTVTLPDSIVRNWNIDRNTTFAFLLAATDTKPGPRKTPADSAKKDSSAAKNPAPKPAAPKKPEKDTTTIRITLEAEDAAGNKAQLLINDYGVIRRPLEVKVLRVEGDDKKRFGTTYELVLQNFSVPLGDFARRNPAFDPARVRAIRFVFAPTTAGTVVLDEIGFSKLDPAFLVAGK